MLIMIHPIAVSIREIIECVPGMSFDQWLIVNIHYGEQTSNFNTQHWTLAQTGNEAYNCSREDGGFSYC